MRLYHNQFSVKPGVYQFLGTYIVVMDVVTHTIDEKGNESELADPLVVFREVNNVDGKIHKRQSVKLSQFKRESIIE